MAVFRIIVRTRSRQPVDLCWEVSFDLEHVAFLHTDTNKSFTLMQVETEAGSKFPYDSMIYRAKRRVFGFFILQSLGYRKVVADYVIHQIEYFPLLRTTVATNCLLDATDDPDYPCELVNEVVIDGPRIMVWLRRLITKALARHQEIQNQEDEEMRERISMLRERGIHMPYSVLNRTAVDMLCGRFEEMTSPRGKAKDSAGTGQ